MGNRVSRLRADVKLRHVSDAEPPDWIRDGLRQFTDEVRLFVVTLWAMTVRPARFARQWASGELRALNPLGFLATSLAVAAPATVVFMYLVHKDARPSSIWRDALGALTPFGYYLALGMLQHAVLRLSGSRRRLRDSCAMALYAGGGPAMVTQLLILVGMYVYFRITGRTGVESFDQPGAIPFTVAAVLSFALFFTCLARSQAGLHARDGIRRGQVALASIVALLVTAQLFALFDPPGNFGLHVVLGYGHRHGEWNWSWRWGLVD